MIRFWPLRLHPGHPRSTARRGMFLAVGLAMLTGAGCTAALKGYPDQSVDVAAEHEALAAYLRADVIEKFHSPDNTVRLGLTPEAWRNTVVDARIRACDLRFNEYQQRLYQEGIGTGIGTDWAVLALSGAGALAGTAANALSAASAGLTGARAAFDKRAFFDQTMPSLLATMTAKRKEILLQIRQGQMKSAAEYSLMAGLSDVDSYYYAGTIPGALKDLTVTAGVAANTAESKLRDLKSIPTVGVAPTDVQAQKIKVATFIRELASQSQRTDLESIADKLGVEKTDDLTELRNRLLLVVAPVTTDPDIKAIVARITSIPKFQEKEF